MQHYFQLFIVLMCSISLGDAQFQCVTPDRQQGSCIDLRQCSSLYNLIRKPNLSIADRNYLRNSQCGFSGYPWVCCPSSQPRPTQSLSPQPIPSQPGSGLKASDLPKHPECGTQVDDRIIGGTDTRITEFPWMVLVEYSKPNGNRGFHCGGVLINKNYVLTASHCVNGKDLTQLRWTLSGVRLGEWDQRTDQDCDDGNCSDPVLDVPVSERIPHPQYNPLSKAQENDIALLRLSRSVQFTDWIKPICLPLRDELANKNFDNFPLIVAGWGKTENASSSSLKLKVEVDGVPLDQCNNVYRQQSVTLTDKQLCAGGVKDKDSCRGDSGGPLMAHYKQDPFKTYYYLAGVVSFGPSPCGLPGWPGVYTRVDKYTDWILANMRP